MLLLTRHGLTEANAAGRLLGRTDLPLTPDGRRQAKALAEAVVGDVGLVVTSPLLRARETAAAFGLPITVDERWIELDYGIYDLCRSEDVPPEDWRRWGSDPSYAFPGGESLMDLGRRVRAATEDLIDRASRELVVVVTHVSPIKAAVAWALGADETIAWRMFCDEASCTRVDFHDGRVVLRSFNETLHLVQGAV